MSDTNDDTQNIGVVIEKLEAIRSISDEAKAEAKETRKEMKDSMLRLEQKVDNTFASKERVTNLEKRVDHMTDTTVPNLITKDQFWPVKAIVYGMVTLILLAVAGAIVNTVVIK